MVQPATTPQELREILNAQLAPTLSEQFSDDTLRVMIRSGLATAGALRLVSKRTLIDLGLTPVLADFVVNGFNASPPPPTPPPGDHTAEQLLQEIKQQVEQVPILIWLVQQQVERQEQQEQLVAGMLLSQLRPACSSKSSKGAKTYREDALISYKLKDNSGLVMCMVTGDYCSTDEVTAGHIYRQGWAPYLLERLGINVHDPVNIIIMRKQLETRFDSWEWTVIPEGPDTYKVHVLSPKLLDDPMHQYISGHKGASKRWQDINGQLLHLQQFATRPARCLCGLHARLAIKEAEHKGWITKGSIVVPDAAWESPTFGDKRWLFDKYFADAAQEQQWPAFCTAASSSQGRGEDDTGG